MTIVHWAVVTLVMIGVFFVPVHGGKSTVNLFLDAVQGFYQQETYLLSLP